MSPIGVTVSTSEVPAGSGAPTDAGTAFFVGTADQGPSTPVLCQSLGRYQAVFGARSSTSATLSDTVETFFREGGVSCYVARVTDATATTASLILNDTGSKPTVNVSALTPGVGGNNTYVAVNTTSGAGSGFTVLVEDAAGNILESHGPYQQTSQLFADVTSSYVTFAQATGTGNTTNPPASGIAAPLTGGTNPSDLTDASYVSTLAVFGPELGPGQVAAPGRTSQTVWTGLLAHAAGNNRFALLDIADQPTSAAVVSAAATLPSAANASYGAVFAPQCVIPGLVPGTTRTVPASAVAAALCARVHQTGNDNQAPAGVKWPLQYVSDFSVDTNPDGGWTMSDLQTLFNGGVNGFTVRYGVTCLYGFSTPIPETSDVIFWDAAASRERMALVADAQHVAEPYVFDTIDGKGVLAAKFSGELAGMIAQHWSAGALYGAQATDAGSVDLSGNTPASEQAGNLVAVLKVRISPFAESVKIQITSVPITESV